MGKWLLQITCRINWQVLEKRISLFDYELIKENNVRSVYFGQFAGYAGMIDGLRGLGECEKPPPPDRIPTEFFLTFFIIRWFCYLCISWLLRLDFVKIHLLAAWRFVWDLCCEDILVWLLNFFAMLLAGLLSLGYSTPFLSVGSTYMYTSLSVAKQAVLAIGEEIKSSGLPPEICPLIFVFTGKGNGNAPLMKNINLPELLLIAYIEILTLMHLYFYRKVKQ